MLETIFSPKFVAEDLVNLGFAQIYLSLMIDGVGSKPFSATTLSPIESPHLSYKDKIIHTSRTAFARARSLVEEEVGERTKTLSDTVKEGIKEGEKRKDFPQGTPRSTLQTTNNRRSTPTVLRRTEVASVTSPIATAKEKVEGSASLKDLLSKTQEHVLQKNPLPPPVRITGEEQHLKDLRSTLARIAKVGDRKEGKAPLTQKKDNVPVRPVSAPRRQQGVDKVETKPKEVPEAVLRKLLDVKEE